MISSIKKKWIILLLVIVLIILAFIFIKAAADYSLYKNKIGVNLPKDSVITIKDDSHDGFHGDGEFYSEVQLSKSGLEEFIKSSDKLKTWKAYPLPKDIEILIHGGQHNGIVYDIGKKSKQIPKNIKNGIYFFRDRLAEEYPNEKNTNILSRHSYNITVAVLDIDTKKLYIYELDT